MSLFEKVNQEITLAMKARNEDRLRTFRNVKASFLLLQSSGVEIAEDAYLKAIQKMAKQVRDSIDIFEKENRMDLANKEKSELVILQELLPTQMSEEEILKMVQEIILQTNAQGMKDLGKVMPAVMKATAGIADGKLISEVVKRLLG